MARFVFFSCALLTVGVAGCGGGEQRAPLHPVRGKVLFEGQPTPDALVVLHPLDGGAKDTVRPRAKVQADGSFTVGTITGDDGAPPGEYAVTVEWWRSPATGKGGWQDEAPVRNQLPVRYSLTGRSGLRAQVKSGDNELPVFRLAK